MKYFMILCLLSLSLTGCYSVGALPGSEKVVITTSSNDVRSCKLIGYGFIVSRGPCEDCRNETRNNILMAGGDTILITHTVVFADHGVVYNCSGVDQRMPYPVQMK
jgi:hypothetical protein